LGPFFVGCVVYIWFLAKLCEILKTIVATLLAQLVTPIHPKTFLESETIAYQANVSPAKTLR